MVKILEEFIVLYYYDKWLFIMFPAPWQIIINFNTKQSISSLLQPITWFGQASFIVII